jgi:DNA-binding transcriptional ArsR family regulator
MAFAGERLPPSKLLVNPTRRRIMKHLAANDGRSSFMGIHYAIGSNSRGNVSVELRKLKDAGFVVTQRSWDGFEGRNCRPTLLVFMTEAGMIELQKYDRNIAERWEDARANNLEEAEKRNWPRRGQPARPSGIEIITYLRLSTQNLNKS